MQILERRWIHGSVDEGFERRRRDSDTKLARHRLSVRELARELGNVAEACRQRGLYRTSFYEWKRRFQTQGFEGLKDLPPIHKSHLQIEPWERHCVDFHAKPTRVWSEPRGLDHGGCPN